VACIDTSCDSGTSMLETYYSNFIARPLYTQKMPEVQEESILASRWMQLNAFVKFNLTTVKSLDTDDAKCLDA